MTRSSLRVENVVKAYGKAKALDGITFEARAGEAIALWGPNGAGKTTLLKAILGLIDYQGDIWVANHSVRLAGKQARRNIGYVPQEVAFHDWSVQATMEFYARLKKVIPARIPLLLDQLGLSGHARKPVSALSGGLKQRLALAIALLADPPVLLFDEPTANLDARARADFLALVESLCKNHTIIFASHRIEEVQALADRILVLENGQLKSILTPEELRTQQMAEVELTLWIADAQRAAALTFLQREGWIAHANGRGTVVVQLHPERKMELLRLLGAQNITIDDFQVEGRRAWN